MRKPMIRPHMGQVISIGSIWADYCKGLVSAECVSWAYLVGLDVFSDINATTELILYEAVYDDIDGYQDNFGDESELINYLAAPVSEFRFWWAAHSRLDDPAELYDACYLLDDKVSHASDFILERASKLNMENVMARLDTV